MKPGFRKPGRLFAGTLAPILIMVFLLGPKVSPAWGDELSEIAFTEGQLALRSGDLVKAVARFEAAVTRAPRDATAWYWLGIAHARAGDDEAAVNAFNQALAIDPDYTQAAYARGNALSRQGRQNEARDDWSLVADRVPGSELAENARLRLEQRGDGREARDWDLIVGIGAEYDTNVVLSPNLGDAPPGPGGTPAGSGEHRSDTRFRYYLNGGYQLMKEGKWRVSTRQFVQATTQIRIEDASSIEYSPSLSIDYDAHPLLLGLDYILSVSGVGGDFYLARNSFQPRLTIREGDDYYTRLFYRYSHSEYDSAGSAIFDRTGNEHRVGVDQFAILFDGRGYARAGTEWKRDLTRGSEYTASALTISGELVAPLPGDTQVNVSAGQTWSDYDNESAFSRPSMVFFTLGPVFNRTIVPVRVGDPKVERTTMASAVVSRQFGDHWSSSAGYAYTINQSSIDAFDHNRSIFSFFVNYDF